MYYSRWKRLLSSSVDWFQEIMFFFLIERDYKKDDFIEITQFSIFSANNNSSFVYQIKNSKLNNKSSMALKFEGLNCIYFKIII